MAPSSAASKGLPDRSPANTQYRPLNAFMAFRSHFSKMLPNMQQKQRSGVLTALWKADPYKNKWTMVAKVFSSLRAELGKDAVSLPSFLEHACNVLGIPPLDTYLQQRGYVLLENETGHLTLMDCTDTNALAPTPQFTSSEDVSNDDEAVAGLFAEHQLLQAVFDRGLDVDLRRVRDDRKTNDHKQWLVQKLYPMAYDMFVGGESPTVTETSSSSRSTKYSPVTAAVQLFSKRENFEFDVLVCGNSERIKDHIFCQIYSDGSDKATVLPTSTHQTPQMETLVGSIHAEPKRNASIKHVPPTANATPTYTQSMAYQSPSDAGKFHVFSSKPSKLGQSIISAASMMDHGILDINETEIQPRVKPKSMTPGMKSYFMEEYISSASNTVLVNHMDYDLEESAANSSTTNTTQQNSHGTANGGTAQGSDSNNSEVVQGSSSRRASFDCLSDSSTVVASEHSPCSSMSAWIERELIRSDNTSLMTGRDQGAISGTSGRQLSGVDHMVHINSASNGNGSDMPEITPTVGYQAGQDRLSLLNSVLAAQLETARKAKASESSSCSNQGQASQPSSTYSSASGHQHSQLPSASSLGKRSRGNSDLDGETRTGDGTPPYDLPHDDTGEPGPSNNNAGNPHKRTMTTRCQASRNDAMGPPPVPPAHRVVPDLDQPVSPQPRESPHSTGIQPREGHSKHLFAGSFERDFRDAFARPNRTQASPDDIPMGLAMGELDGMPGPSASSSRPVRVPTPIPFLRLPSSQAPVTPTPAHATTSGVAASAPATTTTDGPTAPVPPTITPPDTPPLPAVPAATVPQVPTLQEAQLNTQPVRRLSNDQAQSGPSGSRRRRHWHAAQQQQQSESSSSEMQLIQHVARPVETTPRNSQNSQTSQTIRAYQSMQSMHAIQNMQALNSLDAIQGLPGIPTMPPEVPVSPLTGGPPVTPVTHLLPPAASAHMQGQHSPPFENTTTFIELSVPPTMPEHTVEELTVTEYYGAPADMAITGMGMVDFASPEDIARILAFGPEDQDPPLPSVNSMNFQWPPN